jgi:uncharacterized repeat protein (TIGR01451 family)
MLPPRSVRTIQATYRISSDYAETLIESSATVRSPSNFNELNDSRQAHLAVNASADLGITLVGPSSAAAGTMVSFVVAVTNAGPADTAAVRVTTSPPSGLTFVSNTGACGTAIPCDLGAIPAGQILTFTSTYSIPGNMAPGTVNNAVGVESSAILDPVSANNAASSDLQVTSTSQAAMANVGIVSAAPAMVQRGEQLEVVVTVLNAGPAPATAVQVTSANPTGLLIVGNTGDCATLYPCALGTLAPGGTKTFKTTYSVPANAPTGNVTFNASVTSSTSDPVVANNSTSAVSEVHEASSTGTGGGGSADNCTAAGGPPLPLLALLAFLALSRRHRRSAAGG